MRHVRPAIVLTLLFVLGSGIGFPWVVWALGRAVFPAQAEGSLLRDASGRVLGSALIGQNFTRPEYFHPRPSAAGAGYDAANSRGTNLGPTSDKLVNGVADDPATPDVDERFQGFRQLAAAYREENTLAAEAVIPADAVTRSASGLDPDISPANANLQALRVAKARGVPLAQVQALIQQHTKGRTFGLFGEPRVNVLQLNLALDRAN
jgi:K+-transporting ATPase ATPase C chain